MLGKFNIILAAGGEKILWGTGESVTTYRSEERETLFTWTRIVVVKWNKSRKYSELLSG